MTHPTEYAHPHPDTPVLTVHDSLVVPAPFAHRAAHVIRQAFRSLWGLVPRLKFERWG